MTRREDEPMDYYEDPYVISKDEAREFEHLFISPEEAHYIILNSINSGASIPSDTLRVLRKIRDSDDGGDFAASIRNLDDDD
jgi:hypothetical protein